MLLLVGLGNPTPDSENNRHNIGFKIIDAINKKFGLSKQKPKFKGLLTTGNLGDQKIYAIKPLTFMNNSGICIRELLEYFKIEPENVIVFHDDLDVEFGNSKVVDKSVFLCFLGIHKPVSVFLIKNLFLEVVVFLSAVASHHREDLFI